MPERFECTTLAEKALYKYSSFPFSFKKLCITQDLGREHTILQYVTLTLDVYQVCQ